MNDVKLSVFSQSCNIEEEAVEAAISKCSMLETLDVRSCLKVGGVSFFPSSTLLDSFAYCNVSFG